MIDLSGKYRGWRRERTLDRLGRREGVPRRGPLRRLATIEDVASDLARNITGGVLYIDAGRHIVS